MTTKSDMDQFYAKPDPWKYEVTEADAYRKERILKACDFALKVLYPHFTIDDDIKFVNALDVGCGEGFITKDLPAYCIYGYELSDIARLRWSANVRNITSVVGMSPSCDLVVATGVIYPEYDVTALVNLIVAYASGFVVTSHIQDRENSTLRTVAEAQKWKVIHEENFEYNRPSEPPMMQLLRVYDVR